MHAILAPGQGAQRQGFLASWLEIDGVPEQLHEIADAAAVDLVAAGTTMSEAHITDTAVAQPLIVAAGLVAAAALGPLPDGTLLAGHSVGEFTAASVAGVLSPATAMRLVAIRGRAMAAAAAIEPSGMTAILGGDRDEVRAAISAAGCWVANDNGAGQLVAAGPSAALDRLAATPPAGSRLRPLAVAGAFHTELMAPAQRDLEAALAGVDADAVRYPLVSNLDGEVVTDGVEMLRRLAAQVCAPVRWDACLSTLAQRGVSAVIELPPAGTLTAIVRRALPDVTTVAVRTPDDLAEAQALIARTPALAAG
ncbi:MAG TPA: ACP S-malonyltransferase [Mycobacteriales bacterium]|nr:ACP S-malonyltransferase [Mycobacteriales bacterium]